MNHFNGPDFAEARDSERLGAQLERVQQLMGDEVWRTLAGISQVTGDPQASISAQLRHLRKPRFGGHTVLRRYVSNGLYEYQLLENLA
jgi:hypothetical protein